MPTFFHFKVITPSSFYHYRSLHLHGCYGLASKIVRNASTQVKVQMKPYANVYVWILFHSKYERERQREREKERKRKRNK